MSFTFKIATLHLIIIIIVGANAQDSLLRHGDDCTHRPNDCEPDYICDSITNRCRCFDNSVLGQYKLCFGLVGKSCAGFRNLCVTNSTCDTTSYICQCNKRFVPADDLESCRERVAGDACQEDDQCSSNGNSNNNLRCINESCQPCSSSGCIHKEKKFEESCQSNEECINNLACVDGKCRCQAQKNQTYVQKGYRLYETHDGTPWPSGRSSDFDIPDNVCVTKIGGPCYYGNGRDKEYCVRHAFCAYSGYVCECMKSYEGSKDGFCYAKHGTKCTENVRCKEGFVCDEGTCACPDQEYSIYDEKDEICRLVPGVFCNSRNGTLDNCVKGGNCSANGRCECLEGFVRLENFRCGKVVGHGSPCDYQGTEKEAHLLVGCNDREGLSCKDGVCQCKNAADSYNPRTRRCSRPEGFPCRKECRECEGECARGLECRIISGEKTGTCQDNGVELVVW